MFYYSTDGFVSSNIPLTDTVFPPTSDCVLPADESWVDYNFELPVGCENQATLSFRVVVENLALASNLGLEAPHDAWNEIKEPAIASKSLGTYGTNTPFQGVYLAGLDKKYIQVADIDLAYDTTNSDGLFYDGGAGWSPLGETDDEFTGTYDGGGLLINGVKVNRSDTDNIGIFGRTEDAVIKNVKATGLNITGKRSVGGLCGFMLRGELINCVAQGTISNSQDTGVGGLMGRGTAVTVDKCGATATILSSPNGGYAGGLIGSNTGTPTIDSDVTNSWAIANISVAGDVVGGLIGNNCTNSHIAKCWATGNIDASDNDTVGGLAGWNDITSSVVNCYARVEIMADDSIGGLVGEFTANSDIINSYSTGEIIPLGLQENTGGLIGLNIDDKEPTSSYWDTQTSSYATSNGGVGKTTAEMKRQATYIDWNFTTIWAIRYSINDGYPYLQDNPPAVTDTETETVTDTETEA